MMSIDTHTVLVVNCSFFNTFCQQFHRFPSSWFPANFGSSVQISGILQHPGSYPYPHHLPSASKLTYAYAVTPAISHAMGLTLLLPVVFMCCKIPFSQNQSQRPLSALQCVYWDFTSETADSAEKCVLRYVICCHLLHTL